jgi:hypothetical protein
MAYRIEPNRYQFECGVELEKWKRETRTHVLNGAVHVKVLQVAEVGQILALLLAQSLHSQSRTRASTSARERQLRVGLVYLLRFHVLAGPVSVLELVEEGVLGQICQKADRSVTEETSTQQRLSPPAFMALAASSAPAPAPPAPPPVVEVVAEPEPAVFSTTLPSLNSISPLLNCERPNTHSIHQHHQCRHNAG